MLVEWNHRHSKTKNLMGCHKCTHDKSTDTRQWLLAMNRMLAMSHTHSQKHCQRVVALHTLHKTKSLDDCHQMYIMGTAKEPR